MILNDELIPSFKLDYCEDFDSKEEKNSFLYNIYDVDYCHHREKFMEKFSRFRLLKEHFLKLYNSEYEFVARAPGRVNIIGEHIDYAGFSVLPMAVENDILIACNLELNGNHEIDNDNLIFELNHLNPDKYMKYVIDIKKDISNKSFKLEFVKPHAWINYIIAGFNSIINGLLLELEFINSFKIKKINLLVTGNIPCASGLSSSSALTVASALVALKIFRLEKFFSKFEIANATINYERSVGTACGGMDQTISICAEKSKAKLIEFTPRLASKTVDLPQNLSFIIANSLTESAKISTLAYRYNKRVVENKLGLAIIAKKLSLDYIPEILIELKIQKNTSLSFDLLKQCILQYLKHEEYNLEEIKLELNGEENINKVLQKVPYYQEVLSKNNSYALQRRLIHVCEEAERVEKFYSLCENKHENKCDIIANLGKLMNDSHISCKNLYECSSTELDDLVSFTLSKGALGARLTGAGWGGCIVIMVETSDLDSMLKHLKGYYQTNFHIKFDDENLNTDDYFFFTKASQGACILEKN